MTVSRESIREHYATAASSYDWKVGIIERVFGIHTMRDQLLSKAGGKILDVATGTGRNYAYFADDSEVTGIDLSPEMLKIAQSRADATGRSVELHQMDAQNMDFGDDSFDTVVSTLGMCTYPDPVSVVREMNRVCRPGGQLLFLEHGKSSNRLVEFLQGKMNERHVRKIGCHTNRNPVAILKEAGLPRGHCSRSVFGILFAIESRKTNA